MFDTWSRKLKSRKKDKCQETGMKNYSKCPTLVKGNWTPKKDTCENSQQSIFFGVSLVLCQVFQTKFLPVFLSLFRHLFIFGFFNFFDHVSNTRWFLKFFQLFFLSVHFLHLSVFWVLIYFYKCFLKTPKNKHQEKKLRKF